MSNVYLAWLRKTGHAPEYPLDSELLIFTFRSEKKMGLPNMQSDVAKTDGKNKILENPMAQVVRFWPKIRRLDPSY